jgi:hypothetical protein
MQSIAHRVSRLLKNPLAPAIAMAIMFWTSYEHTRMLFSVLIPAGFVGDFLFGKQFNEFLSDLFSRIW